MNANLSNNVRSVYGDGAAADFEREFGRVQNRCPLEIVAKIVAERRTTRYPSSEPTNSFPVVMDFDVTKRRNP